jgi:hypothetical protein
MNVEFPNAIERYVDSDGRLTLEGIKILQRLVLAVQSLDERVRALEP